MPEMNLRQPAFTYSDSVCRSFTKNKKKIIQKLKETRDSQYIYQNKLYNACLQHEMAYGDFSKIYLEQLLIKYYVLRHLILLKIISIRDINVDLLQWFIKFLIKRLLLGLFKVKLYKTKN